MMQYFLQSVVLNMTWAKSNEPTLYWMNHLSQILKSYYAPCIITFGIISNLLSLSVFANKQMRQLSCVPYMIVISISDFIFLLILLVIWLHIHGSIDIYNRGGGCQAVTFITSVCTFLSLWCTVFALVDRTITAYHPKQTKSTVMKCSSIKSTLISGACVAVSLVVYLNISLLYGVIHLQPSVTICLPLRSSSKALHVLGQIDAIWNFALPHLVLLLLTICCYRKLNVIRHHRCAVIPAHDLRRGVHPIRRSYQDVSLCHLVIRTSVFYVTLHLPGHLLRLYVSTSVADDLSNDWIHHTKLFLLQQSLFYLLLTRVSTNILIYCTSSYFRNQMKTLLFSVYLRKCCYYQPRRSSCQSHDNHLYMFGAPSVISNNQTEISCDSV